MSQIIVSGNLYSDLEVRATKAGEPITNVRLGVATGKDEKRRTTSYSFAVKGDAAHVLSKVLRKGDFVEIKSRGVEPRQYTGHNAEGNEIAKVELTGWAGSVRLIGRRVADPQTGELKFRKLGFFLSLGAITAPVPEQLETPPATEQPEAMADEVPAEEIPL